MSTENGRIGRDFEYFFPSIKGRQAGKDYYISMCPLQLVPKIFLFDENELPPELRAQRFINRTRVPEIAKYILENDQDYVFSALTASIDGLVRFEAESEGSPMGFLRIAMSSRFIINDGQHRRAAIELALMQKPELADESIAIVFFLDPGLQRCQQMFADLNRYAVRPPTSLNVLYDKRDYIANITKSVIEAIPLLNDLVDKEKAILSLRSRKLFTLSSIYSATRALLKNQVDSGDAQSCTQLAILFWNEVSRVLPDWQEVHKGMKSASQIRQESLHSHGVLLQALGIVGAHIITNNKKLPGSLEGLKEVNWSRSNKVWEGKAIINGRVSKTTASIELTSIYLGRKVGINIPRSTIEKMES